MTPGSDAGDKSGREQFSALMRLPDASVNVSEAALLIAKEEYPSLDVEAYLRRLDDLARDAALRVGHIAAARERLEAFNRFFFDEQGFRGNHDDYYDPANSYLNDVLDLKRGIPITLSVVYAEIGQRIGLPVFGVGFPGHFLVKYVDVQEEILVDVFFGALLTPEECLERLRQIFGPAAELDPELLRPARSKEIIVRMLRNLKQVFTQRQDWTRALSCCERILLAAPDLPIELRDRGLIYLRLDCFSAALADLERFLQLAADDPAAEAVRSQLPALKRAVARLN